MVPVERRLDLREETSYWREEGVEGGGDGVRGVAGWGEEEEKGRGK